MDGRDKRRSGSTRSKREDAALSTHANSAQGFAQQAQGRCLARRLIGAQLGEDGPDVSFAEAEVAQGRKDLGLRLDDARGGGLAVGAAVRVPEHRRAVGARLDDELAAMGGPVMW